MAKKLYLLARLLVLGLALALPAASALAHALLVRSTPAADARLDQAPTFVELVFSEALEPAFSTATVLDATGQRVDNRDANVDPTDATRMTLTLRTIPDGVFTVAWKASSSIDGHVTTGAFAFFVGNGEVPLPATVASSTTSGPTPAAEVIAKWLAYLAAASIVGGSLFILVVWDPAAGLIADSGAPLSPPWRILGGAAVCLLLVGALVSLWSQAAQAAGDRLGLALDPSLGIVLFTTRFGALWCFRLAIVLGLGLLVRRGSSKAWRVATLVLGATLLLSYSLGSHASTEARPAVPVLGDWVHLLAAAIWVGGLIYFLAGLRAASVWRAHQRTRLASELLPRFSGLAALSVAAIVLSGVYGGVLRVGSWLDLLSTAYGQTLIAKAALALGMVCFGAVNLILITPRMRKGAAQPAGDAHLVRRFRWLVAGETTLGLLVLLAAALLTALPPARLVPAATSIAAAGRADDLRLTLEVSPGRVGVNTFVLTVMSNGSPVEGAKEVELQFTPETSSLPLMSAVLTEDGTGRYSTQGAFLTLPDKWQIQIAVRRQAKFDAIANLALDLKPAGLGQELAWSRCAGLFLFAAAVLAAAFIWFAGGEGTAPRTLAVVTGVALLAAATSVALRPLSARNLTNPVLPDQASVASGQALYLANCVPCHGASGKGDGPIGLTLTPRPADLTIHTIPGVHPDGQLYEWITNGYPGSVMPAWKERLSDTLRWNLVNYLRTLAPTATP